MSYEYLRFFRGERGTLKKDLSIHYLIEKARDDQLEAEHDYIQWVFPNETPSGNRPDAVFAPITREELQAIRADRMAMENVWRMTARMLNFWGIEFTSEGPVIRNDKAFRGSVALAGNHNQLRMTRMLSFFRSMGSTTIVDKIKALLKANVHRRQKARGFWDAV